MISYLKRFQSMNLPKLSQFPQSQEISTAKELRFLETVIPVYMWELLVQYDCVLAGGALTSIFSGQPINDFDIYSRTEESFANTCKDLPSTNVCSFYKSEFSATLRFDERDSIESSKAEHYGIIHDVSEHPFQFVYPSMTHGSVDSILNSFDFTVCQAAFTFRDKKFYFARSFFKDIAKKELIYNANRNHEISTLYRIEKYKRKGYTISNYELLKIQLLNNPNAIKTYKDFRTELKKIPNDGSIAVVRKYLKERLEVDKPLAKEREDEPFDIHLFDERLNEYTIVPISSKRQETFSEALQRIASYSGKKLVYREEAGTTNLADNPF